MNELYLKQLIKGMREKSGLIIFLLGFLLVIFFAFYLLVSALFNKNSLGKISEQAANTRLVSQDSNDFSKTEENEFVIYTVLAGDSSWKVATKLLGDGKRYPEIEKLNKLDHNEMLEVGQILFVDIGKNIVSDASKNTLNAKIFQDQDSENRLEHLENFKTANYVVKQGDSLWKIASENYFDSMVWREIYETNKEVIGSNPDLIFPFTEITLPNIM